VGWAVMVSPTSEVHPPLVYRIVTVPADTAVNVVPLIVPVPVPFITLHVPALVGVGDTVSARWLPTHMLALLVVLVYAISV
jgi:hypothetical protein